MTKTILIAALWLGCTGGDTANSSSPPVTSTPAHKPACDARVAARTAWMRTANPLRPDKATPTALGMEALGACSEKIKDRQLSCGDSTMQAQRDNPYFWEALDLGFTTYVCESPQNGELAQVENDLAVVMGPRRGKGDQVEEMLRELERFGVRMCKCTDLACALEVADARKAYSDTMLAKLGKKAVPSPMQDQRRRALVQAFNECERRVTQK